MMKYPLRTQILSGLSTGLILALAFSATLALYSYGIDHQVFTNNYTTNLLLSDSLTSASGAAPWALFSLDYFLCKSTIRKCREFICKRFG